MGLFLHSQTWQLLPGLSAGELGDAADFVLWGMGCIYCIDRSQHVTASAVEEEVTVAFFPFKFKLMFSNVCSNFLIPRK